MKFFILLIILTIHTQWVAAQTQNDNVVNEQLGVLHQKKLEKAPEEGNYYLTDGPEATKLIQKDSVVLVDVKARYNIRDNQFEIGGIGISGRKVLSFEQGECVYYSGSSLNRNVPDEIGFYKVLFEGTFTLYAKTHVVFKPSNYNLIMDVGSRSDTYLKEDTYYLFDENQLLLETTSTKKIYKHLKARDEQLAKFCKENKLTSQEADLFDMLNFLEENSN